MTDPNPRHSDYPISADFLGRWSPGAFTGEGISETELLALFEAARWAPSSFNSQPWRFLYARRDTPAWPTFLGLLNSFNQSWAKNAAALIVVASNSVMTSPSGETSPQYSHSFDTGAAWMSLALEAYRKGWFAHAMVGFDIPRTAVELHVPPTFRVEAAIAIGRRGDKTLLPESLQARETPNGRNPLTAIAFEGGFPA